MIGISLEPPTPAQTDLWFQLSNPIEDVEGGEAHELTLRARETVAATVRTEHEERSEEHTSELQSHSDLVCRLLLEKKKKKNKQHEHGELLHHHQTDVLLHHIRHR